MQLTLTQASYIVKKLNRVVFQIWHPALLAIMTSKYKLDYSTTWSDATQFTKAIICYS